MYTRSRRPRHLASLAVVPALLVGAVACSDGSGGERADIETLISDQDETTTTEEATEETAATVDAGPPSTVSPDTVPATTAAPDVTPAAVTSVVEQADEPAEPLAVVKGDAMWPELRIIDLRRDGNHVTLDFELVSGEDPNVTYRFTRGEAAGAYDVSGVSLIDHPNRKRYLTLLDEEKNCLCTSFDHLDDLTEDTTFVHSAQFPAPPAGVKRMSVAVPRFRMVDGVPLRDGGQ